MRTAQRNNEVNIEHEKFKKETRGLRVKRVAVAKTLSKKKPMKQSFFQARCTFLSPILINRFQSLSLFFGSFARKQLRIFMAILALLIGLLQVHYQSKNVSPFDTHPTNIWIFFAAACIYGAGLARNMEENHQPNSSDFISHVILSSGALACVSLASVFLPHLLGWLCLALWTLLPVMLARHLIKHIYEWLKRVTTKTISQARDRFIRLWGLFT